MIFQCFKTNLQTFEGATSLINFVVLLQPSKMYSNVVYIGEKTFFPMFKNVLLPSGSAPSRPSIALQNHSVALYNPPESCHDPSCHQRPQRPFEINSRPSNALSARVPSKPSMGLQNHSTAIRNNSSSLRSLHGPTIPSGITLQHTGVYFHDLIPTK